MTMDDLTPHNIQAPPDEDLTPLDRDLAALDDLLRRADALLSEVDQLVQLLSSRPDLHPHAIISGIASFTKGLHSEKSCIYKLIRLSNTIPLSHSSNHAPHSEALSPTASPSVSASTSTVDVEYITGKIRALLSAANIPHYEARWSTVKRRNQLLSMGQVFRRQDKWTIPTLKKPDTKGLARGRAKDLLRNHRIQNSAECDAVVESGAEWIKVSAASPKRWLQQMAEAGLFLDSDDDESDTEDGGSGGTDGDEEERLEADIPILKTARCLVEASLANPYALRRYPRIRLVLTRIEEGQIREIDWLLTRLRRTGRPRPGRPAVDVIVDCANGAFLSSPVPPLTEAVQNLLIMGPNTPLGSGLGNGGMNTDTGAQDLAGATLEGGGRGGVSWETGQKEYLSETLNLDCNVLLAFVSDITNMRCEVMPWHKPDIKHYIQQENQEGLDSYGGGEGGDCEGDGETTNGTHGGTTPTTNGTTNGTQHHRQHHQQKRGPQKKKHHPPKTTNQHTQFVPLINSMVAGHSLVCTRLVMDNFKRIVTTIATDTERARYRLFIPDSELDDQLNGNSPSPSLTAEERVQEFQKLSIHPIPLNLILPLLVVEGAWDLPHVEKLVAANSLPPYTIPVLKGMGTATVGSLVYGWYSRRTTVTGCFNFVARFMSLVELYGKGYDCPGLVGENEKVEGGEVEEGEGGEVVLAAPGVLKVPIFRSLLARRRPEGIPAPPRRVKQGDHWRGVSIVPPGLEEGGKDGVKT